MLTNRPMVFCEQILTTSDLTSTPQNVSTMKHPGIPHGPNLNPPVSRIAENNKLLLLDKYPVLPSFDHWRFPHGDIPAPWSSLRIPSAGLSVNLKAENSRSKSGWDMPNLGVS